VNVSSIKKNYFEIIGFENEEEYHGKILVLQGEKSHRWDLNIFKKNFPKITSNDIKIIEKAGFLYF
jgi:hypothetical protein